MCVIYVCHKTFFLSNPGDVGVSLHSDPTSVHNNIMLTKRAIIQKAYEDDTRASSVVEDNKSNNRFSVGMPMYESTGPGSNLE